MLASLLLLADSRLPAGGHAHSGGLEAAAAAGWVCDDATLEDFVHGRLQTAGRVAAGTAALAWQTTADASCDLAALDWAFDARTPSPAARAASRAQGRALLRVARIAWPSPRLNALARIPNHACLLGLVVRLAGGTAIDAARLAALSSVTGPATAGVRLLSLDPLQVQAMLVRVSSVVDDVAAAAAADAERGVLSSASSPVLDLLAECHIASEVRLFAS